MSHMSQDPKLVGRAEKLFAKAMDPSVKEAEAMTFFCGTFNTLKSAGIEPSDVRFGEQIYVRTSRVNQNFTLKKLLDENKKLYSLVERLKADVQAANEESTQLAENLAEARAAAQNLEIHSQDLELELAQLRDRVVKPEVDPV